MNSVLESLRILISNAKKSLNRPYSIDTISVKNTEINNLEEDFLRLQPTENQKVEFENLKTEALDLLEQHSNKKTGIDKRKAIIMVNMEINELTAVIKLVPIFSGKKDELTNFIKKFHQEIVAQTIRTKQNSFFNFIFNSRLGSKVQNRIKQISIPRTIEKLINALKSSYELVKNSNSILN